MLKIYIGRHGQNWDNKNGVLNGHRNLPLTQVGRGQGRDLAYGAKQAGMTFVAVYSSPLCRALETAIIVTEELGLPPPIIMPELIERDFGVMTGKRASEIEDLCAPDIVKTDTITYFLCPQGAETFPRLLERARLVLAEVRSRHSDGSVLLMTHGDIGKMIFAVYYKLDWRKVLTMFHFGNSELLLLADGCNPKDARKIRIRQFSH